MLEVFIHSDNDSLIAVQNEKKGAWFDQKGSLSPLIEQTFMPRNLKSESISIAQLGYCTLLKPQFVRFGDIFGPNIVLYDIESNISCLEVRTEKDLENYVNISYKT